MLAHLSERYLTFMHLFTGRFCQVTAVSVITECRGLESAQHRIFTCTVTGAIRAHLVIVAVKKGCNTIIGKYLILVLPPPLL